MVERLISTIFKGQLGNLCTWWISRNKHGLNKQCSNSLGRAKHNHKKLNYSSMCWRRKLNKTVVMKCGDYSRGVNIPYGAVRLLMKFLPISATAKVRRVFNSGTDWLLHPLSYAISWCDHHFTRFICWAFTTSFDIIYG